MTIDLGQRHVLVLGLGESGSAMARWCLREGARVRVADTRSAPPMHAALPADVDVRLGAFDAALMDDIDLVAISPGLSPLAEPQRALLALAAQRSIPVCSEIELFAWKLAALKASAGYAPRVVAITGTNGKTTVTRLVGRLCEAAGRSVIVAGNVSPAALAALSDALTADALPAIWVLELSSFQLEYTRSLEAHAATVLNVTQDHLDWHGGMEAYAKAKRAIFGATTVRVLNRDDPRVMAMDDGVAPVVTFGLDRPQVAGSLGVVSDEASRPAMRWLALLEGADPDDEALGRPKSRAKKARRGARGADAGDDEALLIRRLMPVDVLRIHGDHNVANVLAALALGRAVGLPMGDMLRGATGYRGEPHRMQMILQHEGVDFIEDSKGTNVGATVAALQGLRRSVVLIAGGDGKGQDFAPLAAPVRRHARAVVLIGKDAGSIAAALADTGVPVTRCASLEDAVPYAAGVARAGDAVLLSPACASLDMFRDYRHRADVFVAAVQGLVEREAVPC